MSSLSEDGLSSALTETQLLMRILRGGTRPIGEISPRLLERAKKNKVELEVMRRLDMTDRLREHEEARLGAFQTSAAEVVSKIAALDYAVIKFFKPVAYVPSDLDLLVAAKDSARAGRALLQLGFEYVVSEPNCTTMRRDIQVDIYTNPDFLNIPYLGGGDLLEHGRSANINGMPAKALSDEIEAVVVSAHAIYKEQLLTLNDFFTLEELLGSSSTEFARAFNVEPALEYCRSAMKEIDAGKADAPFKVPLSVFSRIMLLKFFSDSETRRGIKDAVFRIFDRRLATLATSRIHRETY